jgi:hypothetical protein
VILKAVRSGVTAPRPPAQAALPPRCPACPPGVPPRQWRPSTSSPTCTCASRCRAPSPPGGLPAPHVPTRCSSWATCSRSGSATTAARPSSRCVDLLRRGPQRRTWPSWPATATFLVGPPCCRLRHAGLADPTVLQAWGPALAADPWRRACAWTTAPTRPSARRCAASAWQQAFLARPLAERLQHRRRDAPRQRGAPATATESAADVDARGRTRWLHAGRADPGARPHAPPGSDDLARRLQAPCAERLGPRPRQARAPRCCA